MLDDLCAAARLTLEDLRTGYFGGLLTGFAAVHRESAPGLLAYLGVVSTAIYLTHLESYRDVKEEITAKGWTTEVFWRPDHRIAVAQYAKRHGQLRELALWQGQWEREDRPHHAELM